MLEAKTMDVSLDGLLPPTSVDGSVFLKQPGTDFTNEIIDLDGTSPCSIIPDSCSKWDAIPDELSFPQLDDLVQLDSWESMVDYGTPVVERSLRPACQSCPSAESLGDWPAEVVPDFPCSLGASQPIREIGEEPVENVSHVFARWLQKNSHRFSLSDISRIKLKKSTIENGMKRLGGGKKGLLYFLKLVLSWIQAHHVDRKYGKFTGLVDKIDNSLGNEVDHFPERVEDPQFFLAAVLKAGSDATVGGDLYHSSGRRKDERLDGSSQNDSLETVATQHAGTNDVDILGSVYSLCNSHSTVRFQTDWTSSVSPNEDNSGCSRQQSGSASIPLFYTSTSTPRTVAPSNVPVVTTFGRMGKQWRYDAAAGSTLRGQIYWQPREILSKSGRYSSKCDALDLNKPNTSAATTRAARMSRMERRKWSVQRNRKRTPETCHGGLRV